MIVSFSSKTMFANFKVFLLASSLLVNRNAKNRSQVNDEIREARTFDPDFKGCF